MKRRQGLLALGAGAAAVAVGAGVWWARQRSPATTDTASPPVDAAMWGLELQTPQGTPLRLADYRGRWLMVNFWATWCPPCIREMPLLEAFYKANAAKSWQVIGIAADEAEAVKTFLARQPVSYPVALAGFGGIELSRQLGNMAGGLPFTVVFTPQGEVAHRHMGELRSDVLETWVQR
jgi:thiol-disulfide isomerase/thioredoxin